MTMPQPSPVIMQPWRYAVRGALQSMPFLLVLAPFAMLFGIMAKDIGFDLAQIMGMSGLVLAGASQLTLIQLMQQETPAFIVIISGLAVNMRMAMYSASMSQYFRQATAAQRAAIAYTLIDQTYVLAVNEYEKEPDMRLDQRLGYFLGAALMVVVPWLIMTYIGATLGDNIPTDNLGMDVTVPVMFIAMIAPSLRSLPHLVAATVSVIIALALHGLPAGLGLLIAAPCAMVAGALTEKHLSDRKAAIGMRRTDQ